MSGIPLYSSTANYYRELKQDFNRKRPEEILSNFDLQSCGLVGESEPQAEIREKSERAAFFLKCVDSEYVPTPFTDETQLNILKEKLGRVHATCISNSAECEKTLSEQLPELTAQLALFGETIVLSGLGISNSVFVIFAEGDKLSSIVSAAAPFRSVELPLLLLIHTLLSLQCSGEKIYSSKDLELPYSDITIKIIHPILSRCVIESNEGKPLKQEFQREMILLLQILEQCAFQSDGYGEKVGPNILMLLVSLITSSGRTTRVIANQCVVTLSILLTGVDGKQTCRNIPKYICNDVFIAKILLMCELLLKSYVDDYITHELIGKTIINRSQKQLTLVVKNLHPVDEEFLWIDLNIVNGVFRLLLLCTSNPVCLVGTDVVRLFELFFSSENTRKPLSLQATALQLLRTLVVGLGDDICPENNGGRNREECLYNLVFNYYVSLLKDGFDFECCNQILALSWEVSYRFTTIQPIVSLQLTVLENLQTPPSLQILASVILARVEFNTSILPEVSLRPVGNLPRSVAINFGLALLKSFSKENNKTITGVESTTVNWCQSIMQQVIRSNTNICERDCDLMVICITVICAVVQNWPSGRFEALTVINEASYLPGNAAVSVRYVSTIALAQFLEKSSNTISHKSLGSYLDGNSTVSKIINKATLLYWNNIRQLSTQPFQSDKIISDCYDELYQRVRVGKHLLNSVEENLDIILSNWYVQSDTTVPDGLDEKIENQLKQLNKIIIDHTASITHFYYTEVGNCLNRFIYQDCTVPSCIHDFQLTTTNVIELTSCSTTSSSSGLLITSGTPVPILFEGCPLWRSKSWELPRILHDGYITRLHSEHTDKTTTVLTNTVTQLKLFLQYRSSCQVQEVNLKSSYAMLDMLHSQQFNLVSNIDEEADFNTFEQNEKYIRNKHIRLHDQHIHLIQQIYSIVTSLTNLYNETQTSLNDRFSIVKSVLSEIEILETEFHKNIKTLTTTTTQIDEDHEEQINLKSKSLAKRYCSELAERIADHYIKEILTTVDMVHQRSVFRLSEINDETIMANTELKKEFFKGNINPLLGLHRLYDYDNITSRLTVSCCDDRREQVRFLSNLFDAFSKTESSVDHFSSLLTSLQNRIHESCVMNTIETNNIKILRESNGLSPTTPNWSLSKEGVDKEMQRRRDFLDFIFNSFREIANRNKNEIKAKKYRLWEIDLFPESIAVNWNVNSKKLMIKHVSELEEMEEQIAMKSQSLFTDTFVLLERLAQLPHQEKDYNWDEEVLQTSDVIISKINQLSYELPNRSFDMDQDFHIVDAVAYDSLSRHRVYSYAFNNMITPSTSTSTENINILSGLFVSARLSFKLSVLSSLQFLLHPDVGMDYFVSYLTPAYVKNYYDKLMSCSPDDKIIITTCRDAEIKLLRGCFKLDGPVFSQSSDPADLITSQHEEIMKVLHSRINVLEKFSKCHREYVNFYLYQNTLLQIASAMIHRYGLSSNAIISDGIPGDLEQLIYNTLSTRTPLYHLVSSYITAKVLPLIDNQSGFEFVQLKNELQLFSDSVTESEMKHRNELLAEAIVLERQSEQYFIKKSLVKRINEITAKKEQLQQRSKHQTNEVIKTLHELFDNGNKTFLSTLENPDADLSDEGIELQVKSQQELRSNAINELQQIHESENVELKLTELYDEEVILRKELACLNSTTLPIPTSDAKAEHDNDCRIRFSEILSTQQSLNTKQKVQFKQAVDEVAKTREGEGLLKLVQEHSQNVNNLKQLRKDVVEGLTSPLSSSLIGSFHDEEESKLASSVVSFKLDDIARLTTSDSSSENISELSKTLSHRAKWRTRVTEKRRSRQKFEKRHAKLADDERLLEQISELQQEEAEQLQATEAELLPLTSSTTLEGISANIVERVQTDSTVRLKKNQIRDNFHKKKKSLFATAKSVCSVIRVRKLIGSLEAVADEEKAERDQAIDEEVKIEGKIKTEVSKPPIRQRGYAAIDPSTEWLYNLEALEKEYQERKQQRQAKEKKSEQQREALLSDARNEHLSVMTTSQELVEETATEEAILETALDKVEVNLVSDITKRSEKDIGLETTSKEEFDTRGHDREARLNRIEAESARVLRKSLSKTNVTQPTTIEKELTAVIDKEQKVTPNVQVRKGYPTDVSDGEWMYNLEALEKEYQEGKKKRAEARKQKEIQRVQTTLTEYETSKKKLLSCESVVGIPSKSVATPEVSTRQYTEREQKELLDIQAAVVEALQKEHKTDGDATQQVLGNAVDDLKKVQTEFFKDLLSKLSNESDSTHGSNIINYFLNSQEHDLQLILDYARSKEASHGILDLQIERDAREQVKQDVTSLKRMLSNEAVGENDKTDFLNSDKDFAVAVQPEDTTQGIPNAIVIMLRFLQQSRIGDDDRQEALKLLTTTIKGEGDDNQTDEVLIAAKAVQDAQTEIIDKAAKKAEQIISDCREATEAERQADIKEYHEIYKQIEPVTLMQKSFEFIENKAKMLQQSAQEPDNNPGRAMAAEIVLTPVMESLSATDGEWMYNLDCLDTQMKQREKGRATRMQTATNRATTTTETASTWLHDTSDYLQNSGDSWAMKIQEVIDKHQGIEREELNSDYNEKVQNIRGRRRLRSWSHHEQELEKEIEQLHKHHEQEIEQHTITQRDAKTAVVNYLESCSAQVADLESRLPTESKQPINTHRQEFEEQLLTTLAMSYHKQMKQKLRNLNHRSDIESLSALIKQALHRDDFVTTNRQYLTNVADEGMEISLDSNYDERIEFYKRRLITTSNHLMSAMSTAAAAWNYVDVKRAAVLEREERLLLGMNKTICNLFDDIPLGIENTDKELSIEQQMQKCVPLCKKVIAIARSTMSPAELCAALCMIESVLEEVKMEQSIKFIDLETCEKQLEEMVALLVSLIQVNRSTEDNIPLSIQKIIYSCLPHSLENNQSYVRITSWLWYRKRKHSPANIPADRSQPPTVVELSLLSIKTRHMLECAYLLDTNRPGYYSAQAVLQADARLKMKCKVSEIEPAALVSQASNCWLSRKINSIKTRTEASHIASILNEVDFNTEIPKVWNHHGVLSIEDLNNDLFRAIENVSTELAEAVSNEKLLRLSPTDMDSDRHLSVLRSVLRDCHTVCYSLAKKSSDMSDKWLENLLLVMNCECDLLSELTPTDTQRESLNEELLKAQSCLLDLWNENDNTVIKGTTTTEMRSTWIQHTLELVDYLEECLDDSDIGLQEEPEIVKQKIHEIRSCPGYALDAALLGVDDCISNIISSRRTFSNLARGRRSLHPFINSIPIRKRENRLPTPTVLLGATQALQRHQQSVSDKVVDNQFYEKVLKLVNAMSTAVTQVISRAGRVKARIQRLRKEKQEHGLTVSIFQTALATLEGFRHAWYEVSLSEWICSLKLLYSLQQDWSSIRFQSKQINELLSTITSTITSEYQTGLFYWNEITLKYVAPFGPLNESQQLILSTRRNSLPKCFQTLVAKFEMDISPLTSPYASPQVHFDRNVTPALLSSTTMALYTIDSMVRDSVVSDECEKRGRLRLTLVLYYKKESMNIINENESTSRDELLHMYHESAQQTAIAESTRLRSEVESNLRLLEGEERQTRRIINCNYNLTNTVVGEEFSRLRISHDIDITSLSIMEHCFETARIAILVESHNNLKQLGISDLIRYEEDSRREINFAENIYFIYGFRKRGKVVKSERISRLQLWEYHMRAEINRNQITAKEKFLSLMIEGESSTELRSDESNKRSKIAKLEREESKILLLLVAELRETWLKHTAINQILASMKCSSFRHYFQQLLGFRNFQKQSREEHQDYHTRINIAIEQIEPQELINRNKIMLIEKSSIKAIQRSEHNMRTTFQLRCVTVINDNALVAIPPLISEKNTSESFMVSPKSWAVSPPVNTPQGPPVAFRRNPNYWDRYQSYRMEIRVRSAGNHSNRSRDIKRWISDNNNPS